MNKSLITNLIATLVIVSGYFSPVYSEHIKATGLFALSGGITNWLAIHMLFEKVPFLYGSGVIPNRFEEFKTAIKTLIIEQFFTVEHIERFFNEAGGGHSPAQQIMEKIDFDHAFDALVEAIMASSFGSMLSMVGGKDALEPLREPVIKKLKEVVEELIAKAENDSSNSSAIEVLIGKVENIIDNRLEELTPQMVKEIIQKMIREHLGWLVVWGGVFGGLIGLIVSFM